VTLHTNAIAGNVVPEGWSAFNACNKPGYEVGIDNKTFRSAPKSYYVVVNNDSSSERSVPCGVAQNIDAGKYAGQRVRVSAFLKGVNITGQGYLFGYVDGSGKTLMSAFTHIKGTTDWQKVTLVFDVSDSASSLRLGFSLWNQQGHGKLWMDDISGPEIVDRDTPLQNAHPPVPEDLQNRP
jgi:hypothetical protein